MAAILVALLANLGIIFTLVGVGSLCQDWPLFQARFIRQLAAAISVGGCAVLLMSVPVEPSSGVIFDLRSVPLVLGGIFGGPIVGAVGAAIAGAYRLGLGGIGAWPGFAAIMATCIVGIVGNVLLKGRAPSFLALHVIGGAAALANLLGPFLLPADIRWQVLEVVALPTIAVVFFATVFVGKTVSNELQRQKAVSDLRATEKRLSESNEMLIEMARIDGLTGIANRRAFDEAIGAEIGRSDRTGAPLSLLLLDVDHFKAFNDHYGHLAGDDGLRAIASAIRTTLHRSADLAARFGGEEFAVLLPGTDREGAAIAAERIRDAVRALALPHPETLAEIVTASIGFATTPEGDSTLGPGELIRRADEALYEAKRTGRDKVISFMPASEAFDRIDSSVVFRIERREGRAFSRIVAPKA